MMNERIESKHLRLKSLSLREMEQIQCGRQNFLEESVLSEIIKTAIAHKIEQMRMTPKEAHPFLNYWLMEERKSGKGIGLIGSKHLPDADGYVEIGYAAAKEFRNKGYTTEAMGLFLDWLDQYPFCSGALLSIRSANLPSVRVAEKCGFQYVGTQGIYQIYQYIFL